jgi:hypothetical protein
MKMFRSIVSDLKQDATRLPQRSMKEPRGSARRYAWLVFLCLRVLVFSNLRPS